jgi:hypothetical protein
VAEVPRKYEARSPHELVFARGGAFEPSGVLFQDRHSIITCGASQETRMRIISDEE